MSSDEAVFSLNSEVNTHDVIRYARYGQGHLQDHHIGNRQGADQVLVWVGLTGNREIYGPHFVRGNLDTREYLRIVRYNFTRGDIPRSPRSPYLAVPGFFLWGYIKQKIWEVPRNQQPTSRQHTLLQNKRGRWFSPPTFI